MFRQYQELKRQYPDVILLFRCGDFYELYGQDAVIGAAAMEITLTSREMRGQRLPMAGVPFHAIDRYLARLLNAGHRAAIAEQMEDPKLAKGLVKRDITRIMTPAPLWRSSSSTSGPTTTFWRCTRPRATASRWPTARPASSWSPK
jgi:DNA mismatch repair protein MutS